MPVRYTKPEPATGTYRIICVLELGRAWCGGPPAAFSRYKDWLSLTVSPFPSSLLLPPLVSLDSGIRPPLLPTIADRPPFHLPQGISLPGLCTRNLVFGLSEMRPDLRPPIGAFACLPYCKYKDVTTAYIW